MNKRLKSKIKELEKQVNKIGPTPYQSLTKPYLDRDDRDDLLYALDVYLTYISYLEIAVDDLMDDDEESI